MDKIIIINDARIENKLESFLIANRNHIRLITSMDEIAHGENPVLNEIIKRYEKSNKIKIQAEDQVWFFKTSDIYRVEGKGKTSIIHQKDRTVKINIEIDQMWNQFEAFSFIRVHFQHIVNVNYIVKLYQSSRNLISLNDGAQVPVSEDYKSAVLRALNPIASK